MNRKARELLTVTAAAAAGRRLVPREAIEKKTRARKKRIPWGPDHPFWKMIGKYSSAGKEGPGSEDKHAYV